MAADLDVEVVGREFVRQYYTVLNQRPDCLHQFFTQDSSFVHGGVERAGEEQPACQGQAVIHQKILSLNFRDCHTKIRQVDCQKTVGNAVLVQVSGELSNNGELMRRFMQSFVLVQQAPKKFYVHNDIFRYQDEVFHDYHYNQSAANVSQEAMPIESEAKVYENHEVRNVSEEKEIAVVVDHHQSAAAVAVESVANGSYSPAKEQQQQQVSPVAAHDVSPVPVAVNHIEATNHNDLPIEVQDSPQQELISEIKVTPERVEQSKVEEAPVVENGENKEAYEEKPVATAVQQQQQKIFSWASMASKNTSSSAASATPQQNKPQATIKPERKSEALPPSQVNSAAATSPVNSVAPTGIPPKQQGISQTRPAATNERKWSPPEGEEGGFRSSTANIVPDNQQLFIGNLPHSITEQEVRELFEKFGNVIDIKINRKGATRDLPNFGFVAFDSHDAVTRAMKARPIMLHGKRRINIEEKKDQSGIGSGPRRIPARGGRGGVRGGARMSGRINGGGTNNQMANEAEE